MTQVPNPPPKKPTPPPGNASGQNPKAAPPNGDTGTPKNPAKQVQEAGKQAKKAKDTTPAPPKMSEGLASPDAARKAPAFERDNSRPKSNLPEEPKSSRDMLKEQHAGREREDSQPSQSAASDQSKPAASQKKPSNSSASGAPSSKNLEGAPETPQQARKDAAKQQLGQAAETGLDSAAGSGATKDLKAMVAKEDEHGDRVGADERAIAAAKNAGRAANIIWGGRSNAINTGIDKVGDGLMKGAQFKKRKKRELKQAVSGKSLMDAVTSPESRQAAKNKKGAGLTSALGGDNAAGAGSKKSSGKDKKGGGSSSGSGSASGMGVVGKSVIGLGAGLLAVLLMATFILGGGGLNPHDGQPSEESDQQVAEYIPDGVGSEEGGWYEVATWSVSHQNYDTSPKQIPWPVIMGLAQEQTDLGRFSPYDSIDRDPDRESTQIITGGGGGGGGGGGDVVIDNTGDMDRSNPAWRQQIAMQAFVAADFTPEQSAGIVGNMITESGVEPARAEYGKPFPSTWGWGLVQWTFSRNTTIVNKVKDELGNKFYTNDPSSLSDDEWISLMELQVEHVIHELDTSHAHAGEPLRRATTAAEASTIFLEKFEVPADIPGNRPVRAAQAEEVLRVYNQGGVDALSDGTVAVNITREEAEWVTFNTEDHVRTEMVSTSDCAVPNPEPAIGGDEGEGVGPYLLTPAAAERARAEGFDPNSPCVGRWIADQLAQATSDVNASDEFIYHSEAPWPYGDTDGPGSGNSSGGGSGEVQWPLSSDFDVSGPYGPRRDPVNGEYGVHEGTDWTAPGGTPIGSIADGTVTKNVAQNTGWGNHIVITHEVNGDEVESLYAHLRTKSPLQVGDSVSVGDVVGEVGNTGHSANDHLHLEIRVNGELVDPAAWLEQNSGSSNASTTTDEVATSGNVNAVLEDLVTTGNVSNSDEDDDDEASDEDEEAVEKFEDNVEYWEAVVATTTIFADKNATGDNCELEGAGDGEDTNETYGQQVIYSFHCEIAKQTDLETVMRAYYTTPPANASDEEKEDFEAQAVFDTIGSRYDSERRIIEEALQVSYTASNWDMDQCDPNAERAGLFQLTAEEMSDGGYDADERCDSAKNAAAAAKLFIDGESEAIDDRPDGDGEFQPALGGWDNVSVAVGTDDREDFILLGSGTGSVAVSEQCYAGMEDWVEHVAGEDNAGGDDGSAFGSFADMDDLEPEEQREKVRQGERWTEDLISGGVLGFGSKTPPHLLDDCPGGSSRDYAEQLGEIASTMAADEEDEAKKNALNGYAQWTGWVRASEGGEPVVGQSALVDRLSVYTYNHPEVPLAGDALSLMILNQIGTQQGFVPVHQRAVEYAIFFGGLSQPFDTAEKIYGSLQEANTSGGGLPGNSGGGGQTEVDAEGCPVEPGPVSGALNGGAEAIGINELCRRSVEQARSPEAAVALKWGFQQVGVQMYSQPKRMSETHSDCSSFISRAYQEGAGLKLYEGNAWVTSTFAGRGAAQGAPQVSSDDLQPGDWWMPNSGHIAMVIADGYVMHSSRPGLPVKIDPFYTGSFNVGGYIDSSYFPKMSHHGTDSGGSSGSDDDDD